MAFLEERIDLDFLQPFVSDILPGERLTPSLDM